MQLEKLCSGAIWSEGPVWIPSQQCVLWSDIPNNRMLRWTEADGMSVWREHVEFTNGHTLDVNGDLLHCSHGQRAIVRTPLVNGELHADTPDQIVVGHYLGGKLNSPNDIVVKRDGTIWFTDPPYGILSDAEGYRAESEQLGNFVFCYEPGFNSNSNSNANSNANSRLAPTLSKNKTSHDVAASSALYIASDWMEEPNGLAFSPDEKTLYVSDTSAALRNDGSGNHHIVAFDVIRNTDGSKKYNLQNPRIFVTISPGLSDGFRIDKHGYLFTSSADSVQIFDPLGKLIGKIAVPEKIGNLCFGGQSEQDLYITASTTLYRYKLSRDTNGLLIYP